jgi:transcriptional regulator with XRE-family HTH domain
VKVAGTPRTPAGRPQLDPAKVRAWLRAKDLSIETAARRAGIAPSALRQVAAGTHASGPRVLAGLCEALGCRRADLVEDPPTAGELLGDASTSRAEPGSVHGRGRIIHHGG